MFASFHACKDSSAMSVRKDLLMDMVRHTEAQAQPRHKCPKVPRTCVAVWCHRYQMVLLTQTAACAAAKGDFTPSHTFLRLMLVSLLSRQAGSRERCSWKPIQRKNNDSCSGWDSPWLRLPRVSASAGDSAREALDTCSRASLVPFGDSVKLDLCTSNSRLVHTGQT